MFGAFITGPLDDADVLSIIPVLPDTNDLRRKTMTMLQNIQPGELILF